MSKKSSFVAIVATLIVALFVLAVVFIPQPATKSAGIRQADEILSPSAPLDPSLASGLSSPSAPQPSRNLPNLPSVANQPTVPVSIAPTVPSSPGGGPMPGGVNSIVLQPPVSSAGSQGNSSGSAAISAAASAGSSAPAFGFYRTPAEILAGKDLSDPAQRAEAVAEMTEAEEARYAAVLAQAEENGIPVRLERPEGGVAVLYDFRDGEPLYRQTLNANAAISTGANLIRSTAPYNLDGNGFKVGVWDDGSVRNTHQEFRGSRVTNKDTAPFEDHATHVAGTIGATGVQTNAKGMAPLVKIDSYDWDNDIAEMTAAGAAQATDNPSVKIPLSNHSYGAANPKVADMGRYELDCQSTDSLLFGLPYYLVFWAAGNEQQEYGKPFDGYQSITFNGLAKNVMTIGAANDAVTAGVRDVAKGTLASFSSIGPCDDGRIKPDIVANGVGLYSAVAFDPRTNASNISYDSYSGTSMATPNAAGSAVLLQQLYRTKIGRLMRSSVLKALIIHTSDDVGRPGPDYQFGWGYMNAHKAADLILAHAANPADPKIIEGFVTASAKTRNMPFQSDGVSPIRATLVWTDPAGAAQTASNSRTPNLINDLGLSITAPDGSKYLPYVMPFVGRWTAASMTNNAVTGTNRVDNVEQVDIPVPPTNGTYTVSVGLGTNSLTGTNQNYALVLTVGPVPTPTPGPTPPPSTNSLSVVGALDFPPVRVGFTAQKTISLQNSGSSPVSVTSLNFGNPVFWANRTSLTVPARSSASVLVTFRPLAATNYASTLGISVDGALALSLACGGSGFVAALPTLTPTPAPPSFTVSGALDFSPVRVGLTAQKTISLQNSGSSPVSVTSLNFGNPVFWANRTSLTVPARSSASVLVTFRPSAVTNYVSTLSFSAIGVPMVTVPCSGSGKR